MSTTFDLSLIPIHRFAGQDQTALPGLHLAEPPRRTARSRAADRLILYMALTGNAPLSAGKGEQLLSQLAATYYKTSGSVTSALRTVVESLNNFMLDRNVRSASTGRQAIGLLTLAVLRGEQLYIAQSGPVHAFVVVGQQAVHFFDPDLSGRGLGLSRTAPVRYSQASLQANDFFVLAARPSPTWNPATMASAHGQGLEHLQRRLLNRQDLELNAVLVQARPGTGRFHLLSPQVAPPADAQPAEEAAAAQVFDLPPVEAGYSEARPAPEKEPAAPSSAVPSLSAQTGGAASIPASAPPLSEPSSTELSGSFEPLPAVETPQAEPETPGDEDETGDEAGPAVVGLELPAQPVPADRPAPAGRRTRRVPGGSALGDLLAGFGKWIVLRLRRLLHGLRRLLAILLPGESLFTIPTSTMIAIAILVPVMIVAIASKVYIDRGLLVEYQRNLDLAKAAAEQAPLQDTPVKQRLVWEATLGYLKEAESYQPAASEVKELRLQAQTALDDLGLIRRLQYRPAIIGGLPGEANIIRLVHVDDDLYMLDSQSGKVLHGIETSSLEYELDLAFNCGPTYASGKLIDIAPLPLGHSSGAAIIGIDGSGNAVYCAVDKDPVPAPFAIPVTAPNWGTLKGFTYDSDSTNLYLLDPLDDAVWVYWGGDIDENPEFFFGDNVPQLNGVVDLTVDKRDLYLLRQDGSLTICSYSSLGVSPTRCTDPAYVDGRPGTENQALTPPHPFLQVYASPPPDPSLYLLEPQSQSIYRFSLRSLNFYRQLLPAEELPGGAATAFDINVLDRSAFLAVGNRIYFASLP